MKTGNTRKTRNGQQLRSALKTRKLLKNQNALKTRKLLKTQSTLKISKLLKTQNKLKTRKPLKTQTLQKTPSTRKARKHLKSQKTSKDLGAIINRNIISNQSTLKIRNTKRCIMDIHYIAPTILIVVLTLLSGFCDAQGFLHASNIWEGKKFIWSEATKSALGFCLGTGMYWFCIRFLKEFKIISPEIQTIAWFSMTILSVALASGTFLQWQRIDQMVGLLVLLGVFWLLVRTAT